MNIHIQLSDIVYGYFLIVTNVPDKYYSVHQVKLVIRHINLVIK